jgi:hypothetical protein
MFRCILCSAALVLAGCASTQLNYNTLDIASSSVDLVTAQVISNLSRTKLFPYAIPSQVAIPAGSITTTNSVTPTVSGPLGVSATTTLANTVAATLSNSTTRTSVTPNGTIGISAGDQWSQNYSVTPLQDPDQLRRLRALYRFGAGFTVKEGSAGSLACEYPLVQKAGGGTSGPATSQTVNVYVNGDKAKEGPAPTKPDQPSDDSSYILNCPLHGAGTPDPAFLKPPGCVICDLPGKKHHLTVNPYLSNSWAIFSDESIPDGAAPLGHGVYLRLDDRERYSREFSDFVLFVLEATLQSTSSSTGAAGKGSPQKGGVAPFILPQPAQPQILLPGG